MTTAIVVAGATGHLGGRIVPALRAQGADVRALVRASTGRDKREKLARRGVTIGDVDMADVSALRRACEGTSCVVSAVQGLGDVVIDAQSVLLDAAIAAHVPRFIPSDYSIDVTTFPAGANRNLDLRRDVHERLAAASIAATSILNGAFTELLPSGMPLLDLNNRRVTYWGNADQRLDVTTMDNTAALDPSTPRFLRMAGDQISARALATTAGDVTGSPVDLVRQGSLTDLAAFIAHDRAADPASEHAIFPRWQGQQYLYNMFSGHAILEPCDNDPYPTIDWTSARDVIAARGGTM